MTPKDNERQAMNLSGGPLRRGWFVALACAYLIFVVYGSLVPLDFQARTLGEAIAEFRQIRALDLGLGSRADWVANILLFVPLAFLWVGVFSVGRGVTGRIVATGLVFGGCVALSLAVEFTQLFFPPRTVSVNDIEAETFGAALGIGLWWWRGERGWAWVCRLPAIQGERSLVQNALWIYLALLFGYSLLPLDLTVSPVEIYHKWVEGRIRVVPFGQFSLPPVQYAYELVTDVLIWVPVALLCVRSGVMSRAQAVRRAAVAAIVLELLQVFVYSRVTDVTDIVTAVLGAVIGSRFGTIRAEASPQNRGAVGGLVWGALAFVASVVLVCVVFWYPFDFTLNRLFLRERLPLLYGVPFRNYYYGTEFRAVTEVVHKLAFFAPIGASLGWIGCIVRTHVPQGIWSVAAVGAIVGIAFVIELGQVALPSKFPDLTDALFEIMGGVMGYAGTLFFVSRAGGCRRS